MVAKMRNMAKRRLRRARLVGRRRMRREGRGMVCRFLVRSGVWIGCSWLHGGLVGCGAGDGQVETNEGG